MLGDHTVTMWVVFDLSLVCTTQFEIQLQKTNCVYAIESIACDLLYAIVLIEYMCVV